MTAQQLIAAMHRKGYTFEKEYIPQCMDVQKYLRRHDIVFKSPQKGGFEGLPIGNGSMAAMVWTTETGLCIQINKDDVWSSENEETPMLQRSCGRLYLDFGHPCNDWLYLEDFELRLSIAEGVLYYHTKTPFCEVSAQLWIDPDSDLMAVKMSCCGDGESNVRISMERYGSRAFPHWYNAVCGDVKAGLGNSTGYIQKNDICLTDCFEGKIPTKLAMISRIPGADVTTKMRNSRHTELEWHISGKGTATLLLSLASAVHNDPFPEAVRIVEQGEQQTALLEERRNAYWKDYWNRSFLHLTKPEMEKEYDYAENLYYIQMYALACASQGKYPLMFNGGLFTWNRDVRQWVLPHHWNMQQSYWAVEAANHPEVMLPYLRTYSDMMPTAKKFAQETTGVSRGLIISEAHDYSGNMILYRHAFTPASQIAQQFWNHYLYTCDETFLRTTAYPFIRECADFYAEYAEWDETDKKYHIRHASVYECAFGENFTDTVVDLTMIRYIIPIACEAAAVLHVDSDRREVWQRLLEQIADFSYQQDNDGEVLAMGFDAEGNPVDFAGGNRVFCRNASPLMPCAIIGKKDAGSRLYQAVKNAAAAYDERALAITPISTIWARLGDGDRAAHFLFASIQKLQHFPQGFFYNIDHWSQYSKYEKRVENGWMECQRDYIYDTSLCYPQIKVEKSDDRADIPMTPFVQAGFETPGILTHTLQEMLLQSYEGVIRVCPAVPEGVTGTFTLKAAGGFMVTASITEKGMLPLVILKSLHGKQCVLDVPFSCEEIAVTDSEGNDVVFAYDEEGNLLLDASAGTYLVYAKSISEDAVLDANYGECVNEEMKICGLARIGSVRSYGRNTETDCCFPTPR